MLDYKIMPKILITEETLRSIAPKASSEMLQKLCKTLNSLLERYDISTPEQVASFLAQAAHETQLFTQFVERGNPDYFKRYEHNTKIGKILGNTQPRDGVKFKGRGIFQLTGRWNYNHYGKLLEKEYPNINLVANPDLAAGVEISCHLACLYWRKKGLNSLANDGNFAAITRAINPGLKHYEQRHQLYQTLLPQIKPPIHEITPFSNHYPIELSFGALPAESPQSSSRGSVAFWTDQKGRLTGSVTVDALKNPELAILLTAGHSLVSYLKDYLAPPKKKALKAVKQSLANLTDAENKDSTAFNVWQHPFTDYEELISIRQKEALNSIEKFSEINSDQKGAQELCDLMRYAVFSGQAHLFADEKGLTKLSKNYTYNLLTLPDLFRKQLFDGHDVAAQQTLGTMEKYFPNNLELPMYNVELKIHRLFKNFNDCAESKKNHYLIELCQVTEKAVGDFPRATQFRRNWAKALALSGKIEEAIIKLEPIGNSLWATSLDLFNLGKLHDHLDQSSKASEWYEKFRQHPTARIYPELFSNSEKRLLDIYINNTDFPKIEKLCGEIIHLPKHEACYDYYYGCALLENQKISEGREILKEIIHLKQSEFLNDAHYQLAISYLADAPQTALDHINTYLIHNPDSLSAKLISAQAILLNQDLPRARREFKEISQISRKSDEENKIIIQAKRSLQEIDHFVALQGKLFCFDIGTNLLASWTHHRLAESTGSVGEKLIVSTIDATVSLGSDLLMGQLFHKNWKYAWENLPLDQKSDYLINKAYIGILVTDRIAGAFKHPFKPQQRYLFKLGLAGAKTVYDLVKIFKKTGGPNNYFKIANIAIYAIAPGTELVQAACKFFWGAVPENHSFHFSVALARYGAEMSGIYLLCAGHAGFIKNVFYISKDFVWAHPVVGWVGGIGLLGLGIGGLVLSYRYLQANTLERQSRALLQNAQDCVNEKKIFQALSIN